MNALDRHSSLVLSIQQFVDVSLERLVGPLVHCFSMRQIHDLNTDHVHQELRHLKTLKTFRINLKQNTHLINY